MAAEHIASSESFVHPQLGTVIINRRRGMVNIVARWRAGVVCVSASPAVGRRRLLDFVDAKAERLLACRTDVTYAPGDKFEFGDLCIELTCQSFEPRAVIVTSALPVSYVGVGSEVGFDNVALISKAFVAVAASIGELLLFPRATKLAERVGAKPGGWRLSRSARTLGSCRGDGFITLSTYLVFLPPHLRDYIVFHELAHLKEMNHSAAFHRLCDYYCGGRERQWRAELKCFRWPVVR